VIVGGELASRGKADHVDDGRKLGRRRRSWRRGPPTSRCCARSGPDFQAELLFHLASRQAELVHSLPDSIRRFEEAIDNGITWQEALNDVLTHNHENPRIDPIYPVMLGFYASPPPAPTSCAPSGMPPPAP
jgi:hypothetical protein